MWGTPMSKELELSDWSRQYGGMDEAELNRIMQTYGDGVMSGWKPVSRKWKIVHWPFLHISFYYNRWSQKLADFLALDFTEGWYVALDAPRCKPIRYMYYEDLEEGIVDTWHAFEEMIDRVPKTCEYPFDTWGL
jgi:hypothetical protein